MDLSNLFAPENGLNYDIYLISLVLEQISVSIGLPLIEFEGMKK